LASQAKLVTKWFLQRVFGYHVYLVAHSLFVAATIPLRKNEGGILHFIERLPANGTVLDIGANVGTMTLLLARKCKQGFVYGYEPIPENYSAASSLIAMLRVRNAHIFNIGLGDKNEEVEMIMPQTNGVRLEGLSFVVGATTARTETGKHYAVSLKRMDELPELRDRRVDGIKIDVEDYESFVLRGGAAIIERDHPLIYCELWGHKEECFAALERLGYSAFSAAREGLKPCDVSTPDVSNYLFVPSDRVAELATR
jgi:FkbM family methyltransferase